MSGAGAKIGRSAQRSAARDLFNIEDLYDCERMIMDRPVNRCVVCGLSSKIQQAAFWHRNRTYDPIGSLVYENFNVIRFF